MASPTIGGAGIGVLTTTSNDAVAFAQVLAQQITAGLASGALTPFNVTAATPLVGGYVLPEPASGHGGLVTLTVGTPNALFADGADNVIVVNSLNAVLLQGGAAGGTLLAGAGTPGAAYNVIYTNITPSGTATDNIAITGGNNLLQTAAFGTGNYAVQTGSGDDTINILRGNATVNAGTGFNQINLGSGNNLIGSEGYDTITGAPYGTFGGQDTVLIGSGQTSINSGGSSFLVQDTSPNPLLVTLGSGVDTVNLAGAGIATIQGANSYSVINNNGQLVGYDTSTGDFISVSGGVAVAAGAGSETIQAGPGNNLLFAGSGNDTLTAGTGTDTLNGARGSGASALLQSGTGGGTTFVFTPGQSQSDTITGFKASDLLVFSGFGQPYASVSTTGDVTSITLTDGTELSIVGVTPQAGQFHQQ